MNLDQIQAKCFIMTLFIRDDGERFLLGDGGYEFKDSQLHFTANSVASDIVEVQGGNGVLLAGQVQRSSVQAFDGYIGTFGISRAKTEQLRTDFYNFFITDHFYTAVYILPSGAAVQRRRGFIVEAPEVRELFQMSPEYHVGLNFEEVDYLPYTEDDAGAEVSL